MDEVDRLRQVLRAKDEFIRRLVKIAEYQYPGALTHLPIGSWDQIPDGEYVPPHAHLMMVLEGYGWTPAPGGQAWTRDRDGATLPLKWVWSVHPDEITQDCAAVCVRLIDQVDAVRREL